jgi:hypothetical protein
MKIADNTIATLSTMCPYRRRKDFPAISLIKIYGKNLRAEWLRYIFPTQTSGLRAQSTHDERMEYPKLTKYPLSLRYSTALKIRWLWYAAHPTPCGA